MKYNLLTFLLLLFSFSSFSQKITREEYINRYQLLAIEEMNRSGIPASITMAQGILESGSGNSELSKSSNNHFGIKCKTGWKGKKVYYDDDHKNECFRKYTSVEESYIDHTNFLMDNPRYAFLFQLEHTDYKGWARGLKKAGYATAHDYDKRLIKIIEDHKLHRLDLKMTLNAMSSFEQKSMGNQDISNTLTVNAFQSHKVIKMNQIKAVVARQGDTYEMLAQEFGLNDWELYKFNDQRPGYRPLANEIVYIQAKKSKSKGKTTHRVEAGESMHYISQVYGIKLKSLCKRNRMNSGQMPQVGQIIKLR
ncbi:glucosaminidase domain-containing protein [Maribellus sp. YY47]|uniref:glucosaminidase domain-containing protein n=1 Tax=Maribellus sp. YY47 TaxID=2929486 RepID=UPI002001A351|nr:glucosaminidase domain-containing protein [Maribellus sp. YY47]MCK3685688.1 glucosaminidase domain-containing protein [Maribellus sp. YY47]